jgi:urease accessory protein UreF
MYVHTRSFFYSHTAKFLSKHIGTVGGHLEDDPFWEILVSKHGLGGTMTSNPQNTFSKQSFTAGLMANSYSRKESVSKEGAMSGSLPKNGNTVKNRINPLTLYQLVDSSVPSGGFAHSNSLEAAHQLHLLDSVTLSNHIWEVLLNTVTSMVPFLIASCQLFRNHYHDAVVVKTGKEDDDDDTGSCSQEPYQLNSPILEKWKELDALLRASTTSHVASRASVNQGSALLRAFSLSFHEISTILQSLKRHTLKVHHSLADCTGHGATCFGAVCGLLNIDDETCCNMFLYTVLRDMVNAAVRMNLIGPLEGGRLIHDLCLAVEKLMQEDVSHLLRLNLMEETDQDYKDPTRKATVFIDVECAHQVCPLIEILSNVHDRLYTRLFNS